MQVHRLVKQTKARVLSACTWLALCFAATSASANPEAQSPEDDILEVVDLPLAVDLAKGSGLSEAELQESVEVAREGGMGASVLSEVLVAESDAVKLRGKKKGLPEWLMARWAAGTRGVDLKAEVKARPEVAKLDPAKKEQLKELVKKQRKQRLAARKAAREALKAQRSSGKPVKFRGKSAHARLKRGKNAAEQAPAADELANKGKAEDHEGTKGKALARGKSDKSGKPGKHGKRGHAGHHGKSSKMAKGGKGKSKGGKKGRGKHK